MIRAPAEVAKNIKNAAVLRKGSRLYVDKNKENKRAWLLG